MTSEQQTTLLIRGAISELPEETQHLIRSVYINLKSLEEAYDPIIVRMAIALRGAELAE